MNYGALALDADEVDAEAIVLGSRGLTGVKSLLLGSVSHAVLQHARPSGRRRALARGDRGPGRARPRARRAGLSAIPAIGLSKRYGDTLALDGLDLEIREGEVYGYLGANGAGKTTTIRLLLGLHRPSSGRAELFGVDAWGDPVTAHRRVAYVAGEPFLWPSMTSAEDVRLPRTPARRRRRRLSRGAGGALRSRHPQEDPRTLQGQPPEGPAHRGARDARGPPAARRADERARSPDGDGVSRMHQGGDGARAVGLPVLAHPQRGRGGLRPRRDPQGRAAGRPGDPPGAAPPRRADRRGQLRGRGARAPAAGGRGGGP
jgi:ABC transporter/Universal stress protein family